MDSRKLGTAGQNES